MTVFLALVLTIAAFALVAYPFFRQKPRPAESGADEHSRELLYRKDTTLSMLKELEFDHQSGILTDEDFHELEERYKKKAVSILRDIDSLEKGADIDGEIEMQVSGLRQKRPENVADEVERQVSRLREKKPASVTDAIEAQVSALRRTEGRFCPQCGARHEPEDRFCRQCGKKLVRGDK